MDLNNFDRVAGFYDWMAKLVFGGAILSSQIAFQELIQKNHAVLILGGGSGKLLERLPPVRGVDYIEKSKKMIQLASRRTTLNHIEFHQQDFLHWSFDRKYDAILCPFFLDCFGPENLDRVLTQVTKHLTHGGLLFVADFERKYTPQVLSKIMHYFFAITTNLESKELVHIHEKIESKGLELMNEKFFHQNMIFSRVYRNL